MKKTMWSFFDKKSFANSVGLLKLKNMDWSFDQDIMNEKNYIDSHSKFVIGTQYMRYYEMINLNEKYFI